MPINDGIKAPEFSLQDENGEIKNLLDFRGKTVLLYFYPKDDTPGCTKEACNFRDDYDAYQSNGVVILGVSPDTPKSHKKFKQKYQLPFPLLADVGHKVCDLYGVWGDKKYMGKSYQGVIRTSFLIDGDGIILKVFNNVKPDEHSADVLRLIGNE